MIERIRAHVAIVIGALSPLDDLERRQVLAEATRQLVAPADEMTDRVEKLVDDAFDEAQGEDDWGGIDVEQVEFETWLGVWRLGWAEIAAAYARGRLTEWEVTTALTHPRPETWTDVGAQLRHAERWATRELAALRRELA